MFFAFEEGSTNFEFSSRWLPAVLSFFVAAQNRIRSSWQKKNGWMNHGRASPDQEFLYTSPAHDSVCVPTSLRSMLSVLRTTCRYPWDRPTCTARLHVPANPWRKHVEVPAVLDSAWRIARYNFRLNPRFLSDGLYIDGSMRRQVMRTHAPSARCCHPAHCRHVPMPASLACLSLSSRAFRIRFSSGGLYPLMRRQVMRFHAFSKCCRCKFGYIAFTGHLYSMASLAFNWARSRNPPSVAMGA